MYMTQSEGQTQVIARAQSISLSFAVLFRLVKCKSTSLCTNQHGTQLSLLIFSTHAQSVKREGRSLKKKKTEILRLLHSSAVMCDIAVIFSLVYNSILSISPQDVWMFGSPKSFGQPWGLTSVSL